MFDHHQAILCQQWLFRQYPQDGRIELRVVGRIEITNVEFRRLPGQIFQRRQRIAIDDAHARFDAAMLQVLADELRRAAIVFDEDDLARRARQGFDPQRPRTGADTKGGRAFSFSALVVVGNENGVVGHGLGKAKEVQEAITKGIEDAKKNLIRVPVMHGTIPHDQWAKEGAAKVLIKPAAHGTGVIAGGSMRAVLEAAGVTDVLAKSLGSANPHNVVKATFKALALLREPINVAKTRTLGLKKVFNG